MRGRKGHPLLLVRLAERAKPVGPTVSDVVADVPTRATTGVSRRWGAVPSAATVSILSTAVDPAREDSRGARESGVAQRESCRRCASCQEQGQHSSIGAQASVKTSMQQLTNEEAAS